MNPIPTDALFRIHTLGPFTAVDDDRTVTIPSGLPRRTLKLVIAKGGRIHIEALMDRLWPESSTTEARKGVRNALARMHTASSGIIMRDEDHLHLAPRIWIDAFAFRSLADRALLADESDSATELARRALTLHRGPFLPDDERYEWTIEPRRQIRRRHVAMLELLSADAIRRGAEHEAIHLLELAIEADPTDDARYHELATLLLHLDRRGRAAELMDRARAMLREYGLRPGPAWNELHRELHRSHRRGPLSPRPARTGNA